MNYPLRRIRADRAVPWLAIAIAAAIGHPAASLADGAIALAQTAPEPSIDAFHELESKYLFGFTQGSDIGEEGEQSIEFETTTSSEKRGGSYNAIEQEIEYESVPSQFFGYELSAHGMSHSVNDVDGLDNLHGVGFSGLSTELRFLIIGRGPGSPFGVTFVAEPEWARIDGTSGALTTDLSSTFRLIADTELIPNRLFAAANLIYQPDVSKVDGDADWDRTSLAAISTALAYRVTPKVALGGELEYDRAYDGLALQTFGGHALYAGPTLQVQFTGQIMLAAAFSTQVAGQAVGEHYALDLTDFERYRGNLKFEIEF